ncbi:MAG: hypothetical protein M1405_02230 [Patescibacteria group bacterium]|nr:hypothetical protein [Patescibacteria group bacterium]
MKKFLDTLRKNRNLSIAAVVVIVLIILAGVFFVVKSSNNSANQQTSQAPEATEQPVFKIAPEDLGITLTAGPGNKTVILKVAKTEDITALDYELSYMATVNGAQVARGAIGHIDIKNKGTPVKQEITLGTCSDTCHYDAGVSNIKLTLKINRTDGKTYQADLTLSL